MKGKYILFIGTVQPRKNLVRLIQAYSQLKIKNLKLVICGKLGWNYDEVLELAKKHGVVITGYISEAERYNLLRNALVYVQPSITEGFGLPVLEAMAAGVPVVSSNGGALPEIVGDAGVLFDPLDQLDLLAKLAQVISNPKLRKDLITKGHLRAKEFSWQKAAKRSYNILITRKGGHKVNILGVGVSSTELAEVLKKIDEFVKKSGKLRLIVTVNPEFVMLTQDDIEFKKILNSADLAVADGIGLKLAGVRGIVPGRRIVEALLQKGYKVFYLGSLVAGEIAKKYGGAFDNGEADIKNPRRNDEIIAKINKFRPDILLVAYGAPWQEKWLWANRHRLKAKVAMGVGGAFDYLTGRAAVPPEWMSKLGLEWLWRLVREPWRWRRQLNLIRFVVAVFKSFFQ